MSKPDNAIGTAPRDLAGLPKAHLHVHLFGSIRRSTVADFARAAGMDRAAIAQLFNDFDAVDGISTFLVQTQRLKSLIKSPEQVERICRELIADDAASGAVHSEPSFVPHEMAFRFGMSPEELFVRMDAVMQVEAARHGMTVAYIIAPNRGRDLGFIREVAEFAVRMRAHGVVGFGYGGDEKWGHERMREAVEIARAGGLKVIPHAGENAGAASVAEAIAAGPDRIAHGVRAVDDVAVLSSLVRLRIPCDVCIGSNVHLGVSVDASSHPLPRLLAAGVLATLNADDSTFFSASILADYQLARHELHLDDAALATLARNSINAAAMPEVARRAALAKIERWLDTVEAPVADGAGLN